MLSFIIFGRSKCESSSVVEHQLPKLRVAGSTPVSRSKYSRTCKFNFVSPFYLHQKLHHKPFLTY